MSDGYPETVRRDILYFDYDRPTAGVGEVLHIKRKADMDDVFGFHAVDPKVVV